MSSIADGRDAVAAGVRSVQRPRPSPAERAVSLSLVIPTYNESENIREVLARTCTVLEGYPFEIIVVDDESPNGTGRLVRDEYADDPRVTLVRRTGQRGLGMAIARGLTEASNEVCAVMDADLQHPPEKLHELLEAFDPDVDLVVASRYVAGGHIERWSMRRRVVSRVATALTHLALPPTRAVADPLSGFFVVRRSSVQPGLLAPIGYKILLEILSTAPIRGIREIPYVFVERERGASKLGLDEYLDFLKHLLTLRWRYQATG